MTPEQQTAARTFWRGAPTRCALCVNPLFLIPIMLGFNAVLIWILFHELGIIP